MKSRFTRLLYPKTLEEAQNGSYTIALFRPQETVLDGQGQKITSFKAVGYYLPLSEQVTVDMTGHWRKDAKYGLQFEMESYEEVVESGKKGLVAYLSSGRSGGLVPNWPGAFMTPSVTTPCAFWTRTRSGFGRSRESGRKSAPSSPRPTPRQEAPAGLSPSWRRWM